MVDLEIEPQTRAVNRSMDSEMHQGSQLATNAGGYYRQLAEQAAGSQDRQKAINERLQSSLREIGERGQQYAKDAGGQADKRIEEDSSLRGSGLEGGAKSMVAGEIAAQQGRANNENQAAQRQGAQDSQAYESRMGTISGAQGLRGGELQQQLANRMANRLTNLRGQRADLEGQRGPLFNKHLNTLRQSGFENLVTLKGLDIKEKDLMADAADQNADRALAADVAKQNSADKAAQRRLGARGQNITARGQKISANTSRSNSKRSARTSSQNSQRSAAVSRENSQRSAATSTANSQRSAAKGGGRGKAKFTPAQKRGGQAKFRKAMSDAAGLRPNRQSGPATVKVLVDTYGHDPLMARAAVQAQRGVFGFVRGDVDKKFRSQFGFRPR